MPNEPRRRYALQLCMWVGLTALATGFPASSAVHAEATATLDGLRLSGPHSHQNVSLYMVHGQDASDTRSILTLDEALAAGKVVVFETGNVNELAVENVSQDQTVFIHAGSIVKGGQQDRTLSNDVFLKPGSGRVPLDAFCVEAGRWEKRGTESARVFSSAEKLLSSKELKLAALRNRKQGEVWREVAALQQQLSAKADRDVTNEISASSLQLSLENEAVEANANEYRKALGELGSRQRDVIGYVVAINGVINSGDVYASHDLFARVWPSLVSAVATEALAKRDTERRTYAAPPLSEVEAFLARAEHGELGAAPAPGNALRETQETLYLESGTERAPKAHRSYLWK